MKDGSARSLLTMCLLVSWFCAPASGQSTEAVLYSFGAYPTDGIFPQGGLLFDSAGNIYGTTNGGGEYCQSEGGCGTIYELSPAADGEWTETILYNFCSAGYPTCADGSVPNAGLIMDGQGNLYGTTHSGGTELYGVVFRLSPPTNGNAQWAYAVLWRFARVDGANPGYGKLNMDSSGSIYGTTQSGGKHGFGTVFQLSPRSDGTYSLSTLHSFSGRDGAYPAYGVAIDEAGNLYGTTVNGGLYNANCHPGCGVVYEVTSLNGTWQYTVLYQFNGVDGQNPFSPISLDPTGELYGTFEVGGGGSCFFGTCGGVFKLVPESGSAGNRGKKYTFYFDDNQGGGNPQSGVVVGPGNTLYGSLGFGGNSVYELNYENETVLYTFCSLPNCADGSIPALGDIVARQGSVYGSTSEGGLYNLGVVYSLTR